MRVLTCHARRWGKKREHLYCLRVLEKSFVRGAIQAPLGQPPPRPPFQALVTGAENEPRRGPGLSGHGCPFTKALSSEPLSNTPPPLLQGAQTPPPAQTFFELPNANIQSTEVSIKGSLSEFEAETQALTQVPCPGPKRTPIRKLGWLNDPLPQSKQTTNGAVQWGTSCRMVIAS